MTLPFLEEAVLGVQRIAYRLVDEEGRPLGEIGAIGAEALGGEAAEQGEPADADEDEDEDEDEDAVAFDLAPAPFVGCRTGLFMNVSALRQVSRHMTQVLGDLAWVRDSYVARTGRSAVTVFDLWRIGEVATSMPAWLHRNGAPIPARAAAQFKVSQGIGMTCRELARAGRGDDVLDAGTLMMETEQAALFVASGRACAGSPRQVEELFRVATHGQLGAPIPPLADMLGDLDAFFDYALAAAGLFHTVRAVRFSCAQVLADLPQALHGTTSAVGAALASSLANVAIREPETVADVRAHARTELAWRGLDPAMIPVEPWSSSTGDIDRLAVQFHAADSRLAGSARTLARVVVVCDRMLGAIEPAILTLIGRSNLPAGDSIVTYVPELHGIQQAITDLRIERTSLAHLG